MGRSGEVENVRGALVFSVLSVLTLIILYFVGVPAVSRMLSFIGNFKKEAQVASGDTIPPAPPRVDVESEFTNQKEYRLQGKSEAGATITLSFNNDESEIVSDRDGSFTFNLSLDEGENNFYLIARDTAANESLPTKVYKLSFDERPPAIKIISPAEGSEFFGSRQRQLTIKGETEKDALVTMSEKAVKVNEDGSFEFTTSLVSGDNAFNFIAKDRAGNTKESFLSVKYTPE